jgi:hypothetical protein
MARNKCKLADLVFILADKYTFYIHPPTTISGYFRKLYPVQSPPELGDLGGLSAI